MSERLEVAIPIYPGLTALDAVGPYEVFQRVPAVDILFVGRARGEVRTEHGMLGLMVDATFEEVREPDVVVVPGGPVDHVPFRDGRVVDWVRRAHATSRLTTSVCTGSLVLAAAGLLTGLRATTHWSRYDVLEHLGAVPAGCRVVEHLDRRIVTAAGVSSGIDMALRALEILFDRTAGEAAQLMIEYDPEPPFECGSPSRCSAAVVDRAAAYTRARLDQGPRPPRPAAKTEDGRG